MQVSILPVGDVDAGFLKHLAEEMRRGGLEVESHPPCGLPPGALSQARNQHRASAFLKLAKEYEGRFVLAITDVDLYAEPLNFVFGQAEMGGGTAVISLTRLKSVDGDLFLLRALKEALHELGHAAGLGHCASERCVMHFSNTLADTDLKGPGYCDTCHSQISSESLWEVL